MNNKKSIVWLLMGCISVIKAMFMALQNRLESTVKEVLMTMNRIGNKKIIIVATIALFLVLVFFVFPVSATDDLPNAIGRLLDYNKVKIITIIVMVAVVTHIIAFLKGGASVKTIDLILEALVLLVIGAFFFYNWKMVVNYVLSYIPDFSDFL